MSSTASLEGVKKAVFFPFKSKNWGTKWLIGSALTLANFILPLVPMIPLYGYAAQIAKRVLQNDEDPDLPDWSDWGLFFSDGIKVFGASVIFGLPGALTMLIGYAVMLLGNFSFMFDPSFYSTNEPSPEYFIGSMGGMFVGMLMIFIGVIVAAAGSFLAFPALGHLLAKGEFGAAFRFQEWWPVFKANLSGYILAMLILYGVSMGLVWVAYLFYFTIILCFLMPLALCVAMFLTSAIHFSLLAVAYRDGVHKLAEAGN